MLVVSYHNDQERKNPEDKLGLMEFEEGVRWRKQGLKPITTKTSNKEREDGAYDQAEKVEEEPLSPSARLFHEPHFNVYVIAIMGCKTKIYPEICKANLVHTLLKHPRFSSLQVFFFFFLIKENDILVY